MPSSKIIYGCIYLPCIVHLYAPTHILRLADQKFASIYKLYCYVLQSERMLPKYLAEAIEAEYIISPRIRSVLEDTTHSVESVMEDEFILEEEEEAFKDSESDDDNDFDSGGSTRGPAQ